METVNPRTELAKLFFGYWAKIQLLNNRINKVRDVQYTLLALPEFSSVSEEDLDAIVGKMSDEIDEEYAKAVEHALEAINNNLQYQDDTVIVRAYPASQALVWKEMHMQVILYIAVDINQLVRVDKTDHYIEFQILRGERIEQGYLPF